MNARSTIPVFLAAITGWFWRVGYETWPGWEPVMFLAGMSVLMALNDWVTRHRPAPKEDPT